VLYFANRSADSSAAYLADGLTDEIIQRLTLIERLTVKSRTAVERYRGRSLSPDSLGRTLRVAYLVSGAVQQSGRRLRVSVELTRASTGRASWAATFDRQDADLLDIQTAIADTVAQEVAGHLLPDERAALTARPTRSGQAWDRFQRGSFYLGRRTAADTRLAIRDFETAVRLDPTFAAAHARIAFAYGLALDHGWPEFDATTSIRDGLAESGRALELDSSLADAWTARGYVLRYASPRTYSGVREAFTRAIALAPRDVEAHLQYGWALEHLGDRDGALAHLHRAIELDPERFITRATLAWVLLNARRYADVVAQMDTAIAVEPGTARYALRAWGLLLKGDTAGARADLRDVPSGGPHAIVASALAALAARSGDTTRARVVADSVAAGLPDAPAPLTWQASMVALAYAASGQADRAVALLERIAPQGLPVWWVTNHPGFDPIRADPRFARFTESLAPPSALTH
jgi:TolB-like protein